MAVLNSQSGMGEVLVIDDDAELCQLVAEYLAGDGYSVEAVHNGSDGLARVLSGGYSIAVLDVMLPDMEGFEVLRRLRARSQCPVLMLTARGDEMTPSRRAARRAATPTWSSPSHRPPCVRPSDCSLPSRG